MKNLESVRQIEFPKPTGIIINMMPFILGDIKSLPENLRKYEDIINACEVEQEEQGKICYLTITETSVSAGKSHRRGGIHTERHPSAGWGGGGWGRGTYDSRRLGGIYIASNVENSTAIWDYYVEHPGEGGDIEHLRNELGNPDLILSANQLAWITDATPHESLPIKNTTYRQFFRLVTSEIDLWFSEYSDKNPLGIIPPEKVRIYSDNAEYKNYSSN